MRIGKLARPLVGIRNPGSAKLLKGENMFTAECPFCGLSANAPSVPRYHLLKRYHGCSCARIPYLLHDWDLGDAKALNGESRGQISCLLRERSIRKKPSVFLQFKKDKYPEIEGTEPVFVHDWLRQAWPKTVREKIDRTLQCIAALSPSAGHLVGVNPRQREDSPIVTDAIPSESPFILQAAMRRGWIADNGRQDQFSNMILITEDGWDHLDSLERAVSIPQNPAFVAMAFSKNGSDAEQWKLYKDAITPAVLKAGYKVTRADSEHNEYIMDKIMADIRSAPFIVAEISEPNNGVYYEAGFAVGLKIPVITCCRSEQESLRKVHFDIAQKNRVQWSSHEDLIERLRNRIEGSIGHGPYSPHELGLE